MLSTVVSGVLPKQNPRPLQGTRIDVSKTSKAQETKKLIPKLKKSGDGAGCSLD